MPITLSQARQNAISRRLNAIRQPILPTETVEQTPARPTNNGGVGGGIGYTLGKMGTGALRGLEGIWDFVAGGVADLFGADEWAQEQMENSPFDKWNEELDAWYNPNGVMQFVGDVAGGVGQMLPSIAASAIPVAGPAISAGMFMTSAAGQSVSDAVKESGELGGKEWLYGTASGAVEGAIEKISGGIGGTRLGTVLGKQVAKNTAGKLATTFVGEGLEEVASDLIDPALRRVTGVDPDATVDVAQLPNTFLVGGTAGAVLGGGSRLVNARRAGGFNNLNAAEDANAIREARARGNTLQAEGRLTDKWVDTLSKSEQEAALRLSTRLQRMSADTRAQFIEQNNLGDLYDANGVLAESTAAEPQEYNRDAISYSARNLVGRSDADGNSVLKYAPTKNAVREDIAQAAKDIAKLSNGDSRYVVVDTLTVPESGQKANAFYDNETGIMYIANDADASDTRSFVVSHEYVHSLEGGGQYSRYANEVLAEIAQSPEYRKKYDYDEYYARYKRAHPNVQEETLNYIVETEMVADFTAKEILTNESAIRRLANRDASLVRRIYEWVKEKIRQLSTGGGSRESVAYLRKAERLLAKAMDNPGGGIGVNEMDKYVREEKARRNNREADTEAETAEAGEARRLKTNKEPATEIRFSLMNERSFNENVDDILSMSDAEARANVEAGNFVSIMKHTPDVILNNVEGAEDLEVIIRFDALYLASREEGALEGHYHALGAEITKQLPELISNPDAIVRMDNGRLNIFAEMNTAKGNNGIIAIELNTVKDVNSKRNKYNLVVSAFSTKENYVRNLLQKRAERVEYMKKDLSQLKPQLYEWLASVNERSNGSSQVNHQLHESLAIINEKSNGSSTTNNSIRDNTEKVKRNGQNSDNNKRYSLTIDGETVSGTVEETNDLVALHNLTEEKLLKVLDLGGFPMPSIAVTKPSLAHDNFGDITVVFGRGTIDPQRDSRNKVFSRDAWTPTTPRVEYKLNEKRAEEINRKINSLIRGTDAELFGYLALDESNMTEFLNRNGGDLAQSYRDKDAFKYAYLRDKGIEVTLPTVDKEVSDYGNATIKWVADNLGKSTLNSLEQSNYSNEAVQPYVAQVNELVSDYWQREYNMPPNNEIDLYEAKGILREAARYADRGFPKSLDERAAREVINEHLDESGYNAWIDELFSDVVEKAGLRNNRDMYTSAGRSRSFEALHDDYTLENVVRAMSKADPKGGSWLGLNPSSLAAKLSKEFKSISDMKKAAASLTEVSDDAMSNFTTTAGQMLDEITTDMVTREDYGSNFSYWNALDGAREVIGEIADRKLFTEKAIADYMKREYSGFYNYNADIGNKILGLFAYAKQMTQTGYFEAKPRRAVGFEEILRVLLPAGTNKRVTDALDKKHIPYEFYKEDESRSSIIQKMRDVRFSLPETDSDGNKLTAEQREFFGKSAIVDADGKLLKMYHGTGADFTVFDLAESGASNDHTSHIGFWFTPRKAVAENFAEFNANDYQGKKARVQEVYLNIVNPKIYAPTDNSARMDELRTENTRLREQLTEEYAGLKETVGQLNYMLYFTEDNIFGRRGENDIGYRVDEDYYVQYMKMSPEQAKKAKSLVDSIKKNNKQIKANETEYYRLQDGDSFLQMSDDLDEFMEWITGTHAHERGFGREHYAATNAREAAEKFRNKLIKEGYDGIWIKDTRVDDSGDQIVAFSPEQIKLVTNKQPTINPDIRYALSTDSQGNSLTQQQQEYFKDSKVRDENGNLLPVYHGSPNEFFVFDRKRMGKGKDQFGAGFYFATSEEASRSYGDNVHKTYLNITKPIVINRTADGGDLFDVKITQKQAYEILKRHPLIYDPESSPLGDMFEEYWEVGAKDYMIREAAKNFNSIGLLDSDYLAYRNYPNELHEAIRDVLGYDGVEVRFDNTGDRFYVAWFENQIKQTSNKNPTGSADIRYSISQNQNTRDENYINNKLKTYTYADVESIVDNLTINKYGDDVVLRGKKNVGKQIYTLLNETPIRNRRAKAEQIARQIVYQNLATQSLYNTEEIENARRNGIEIDKTWIDKKLSTQLSETENEAYVRELRDELLRSFETTGKLNDTGRMYLRYKDMEDRLRTVVAKEEVLKTARKLKKKNYPLAFDGFDSVKKALSKIEYRSDINKSSTREIVAAFGQFYTPQNAALDGYYSNEVREAIDNFLSYNGGGNLDLYELEQLDTILIAADHLLRSYDKAFLGDRTVSVTNTAQKEIAVVKENAPEYGYTPLGRKGMLGSALRSLVDMRTLMRWVDGGNSGIMTELFEQLAHGSTVQSITVMDLNEPFEAFIKENKKFYKELDKNITFKFNGVEAEITRAEAISLYLTSLQEDGLYHLAFGGFTVGTGADLRRKYNGKKPFYGDQSDVDAYEAKALRETKADMSALYEQFNTAEKEYIRIARDLFNNKAKRIKQDVDMKRMGITNARVENYFPMRVYEKGSGTTKPAQGFIQELNLIANQSIHKDRVKGSKQTLMITPVNMVIMNHIRQIAMYNAYAIPLDTFRRILNKNVAVLPDGKLNTAQAVTLKTTVQENAWGDFAKFIERFEMDVQGANIDVGTFDKVFRWIRSNYAKFQLGLNIKTMASQLTSLPMVGGRVGWGNLLKGTFAKVNLKEMFEYSEWARARAYEGAAYKSQALVDNLDTIGQLAMKPIGWVDMFTMNRIYNAAKYYVASRDHLSLDSVECKTKAAKLLEELGRETQNNSEVAERSAIMRSRNEIVKSIVMFSSDAMKQFSTLVQSLNKISFIKRKLKRGIGDKATLERELKTARREARQAFASVATSMTFYVLMGMLINYGLFAKEPEDDETMVSIFLENLGGSVTGMIPLVRELYSFFVEGYELDNFVYDTFNGLTSAVKNVFDLFARAGSGERVTNQEWMLAMRKFIYAAGQVTGLPTRNIYNAMYGLIKRFSPSAAYDINSLFYGASIGDLSKAIEKGDEKLANTVTQQLLADKGIDVSGSVAEVFADLFSKGYSMPKGVPETFTYNGEEYALNAKQSGILIESYAMASAKAEGLVNSEDFIKLSDDEKANALKLLFNYYYYAGINQATGAYGDNRTFLLGEAIDISKIAVAYGKLSALTADTDRSGNVITGTKKAKVQRLVNSLGLTAAQKYILMGYLGYKNANGESLVKSYIGRLGLTKEEELTMLEMSGYAA